MDAIMRSEHRRQAQARRRPPQQARRVFFPCTDAGEFPQVDATKPLELMIAATDSTGEPAVWLTDAWWIDAVQLWKNQPVTVHLLATPGSLLNPVILHQLNMLKRIVPQWKVVAEGYVGDIHGSERLEYLAMSAYDDVRLIDGHRPGSAIGSMSITLAEVCARIGEIQAKHRISRPIITTLSSPTQMPTSDPQQPAGYETGFGPADPAASAKATAAV